MADCGLKERQMLRVRFRMPNATGGWVLICEDGSVQYDFYGTRKDYVLI